MGTVHAEITLKNITDEAFVRGGYIRPEEIRTATVTAVVDTGSMYLVITEELRKKLGLAIKTEKTVRTANGQRVICNVTESVEIIWKDRDFTLPALVLHGAEKILLGVMALEGLDLMVNPVTQELVGVHGDQMEIMALALNSPQLFYYSEQYAGTQ